jgi:hypothetical protein
VGSSPLADYGTSVSNVTIGVPSGVQSGDTMLAQVVVWDPTASDVPTPPAGWTSIRHDQVGNGNQITSWLYYKVAGASESASYSWSLSSNWAAGVMGAWRGASLSPIDKSSGSAVAGASPLFNAAPSLTPAVNNELQIYFYGSQAASGPAITLSGSISQRFNVTSSKEGYTLAFGDLAAPSGGSASPTYTATAGQSGGAPVFTAQAVLLVPAQSANTSKPGPKRKSLRRGR